MKKILMLAWWIGSACSGIAGDFSFQLVMPEKVAMRPGQTDLLPVFVLTNRGEDPRQIETLLQGGDTRTWFCLSMSFELVDQEGKKVAGGYVPLVQYAGSRDRGRMLLMPGQSIRMALYRTAPFQISKPGAYSITARARLQNGSGEWGDYESSAVNFAVE